MLWLESGDVFAVGSAGYSLAPSSDPKIGIRVEVDGIKVWAVVDTGSPYLVCSLELARQIEVSAMDQLGTIELRTHVGSIRGSLYRLPLRFIASEGVSVEIETTVVVPDLDQTLWQNARTFLGFRDCLARLRFAIDPSEEKFYFGPHP
jgi:hypothetical protein